MSSAAKNLELSCFLIKNHRLRGKQVGSQASHRVTRQLAWIQPICISIFLVPAQKGLLYLSISQHGLQKLYSKTSEML